MRNLTVIIFLTLFFSLADAREVAGIDLPDEIKVEAEGAPLVLNGAGIRKKFFFSIYLASLYLPSRTGDAAVILDADKPNRVRMDMLYSKVDKEKFVEGWNDGFAANHSEQQLAPLKDRVERFNGMFETLREGDRVLFDYLPAVGTRVTINGSERGVIPGHDFNQALLKIWLGDSPVTKSLKRDLLGE
jgi:hypothetical protein